MRGDLVVGAWAGIHNGCDVSYNVEGSDDVYVTVRGTKKPDLEFYFQADALRQFVEQGNQALAEMSALASEKD